jgi:serum/glucocorticoid-regulated kinase 2
MSASSPVRLRASFRFSFWLTTWGLVAARGLAVPQAIPDAVQRALSGAPPGLSGKRQSMQRATRWWLPYIILEFDRNQVMIDAVDGDLSSPIYNYRASL